MPSLSAFGEYIYSKNEAPRSKLRGIKAKFRRSQKPALPSRSAGACAACHPCSKSPTRHFSRRSRSGEVGSLGDGALQGIPAKANKGTVRSLSDGRDGRSMVVSGRDVQIPWR